MSRLRALAALVLVLVLSAPASGQVPLVDAATSTDTSDVTVGDEADRTALVDPFIGTFAPGFTNPGPVLPHGMVGLGPDTAEGPLNYGGYYVNNTLVTGFSHTHMSAGVFHGGHIPVMPVLGDVDTRILDHPGGAPVPAYASPFDRATEAAEPGFYTTTLTRYGVTAELTATLRTGLHRYTFPALSQREDRHIVVDVGRTLRGLHGGEAVLRDDGLVTGVVHTDVAGPMPVHFALEVDKPMAWTLLDGEPLEIGRRVTSDGRLGVIGTPHVDAPDPVLGVRVGISYTDEEGAITNLRAEQPGFDLEATRAAADAAWEQALGRIEVTGANPADTVRFHTALYHAQLFPNLHSDVDGRYRGPDQRIHRDTAHDHYSQLSLWDSYNGQSALQAVIDPDAYADMLVSLADFADQNGGVLPRWQLGPNDPGYMSGDPVIPFIGEGWCRGLVDDGLADRLEPAMRTLLDRRPAAWHDLGYLPVPHAPLLQQLEAGGRNAGTTLEYGLADFALALMTDDEALAARSLAHRTLLDPETGFVRPRDETGAWLPEFSPENGYGFQEGTSWQYSWLAAHDYGGLLDAMGDSAHELSPEEKLDVFFGLPASGTVPVVWPKVQNQATAFGVAYYGNQYAPGNEHDLQAPFAYSWLGVPWKTQAVTRAAVSVYTPTPDGLPGNDDLGALSGWLVWAMLGLHPAVPGAPGYTIASPMFTEATIHRPGHGDLVITADGASAAGRFVQDATLEGAPLDTTWLTDAQLGLVPSSPTSQPTTLSLEMGEVPSDWAAGSTPPSASTDPLGAWGCAG
ncbi:GH92 family glycosyl hydrolase [Euzebya rosea]|uniref:GH92 family glycosyl hydrolase n=1 Tax=Euzebya rosea TaxID=2052804 RepID=UPI000D3EA7DA|nr:GH92 family glycosyl hydrolase [Euzebya rosea]